MHARHRRPAWAAATVLVSAALIAACSSSSSSPGSSSQSGGSRTNAAGRDIGLPPAYNNAAIGFVNKTTKATHGTIHLGASGDCASWDPGRTYYGWCWNMQRLFTRTLVGYSSIPGANNAGRIEPDLATSLGHHNADFTQWSYTLKSGLKWQDGTPVTTNDIKYGLERLYATDIINGGPTFYYLCLLDTCDAKGDPTYKGPYKDRTGGLTRIRTTADTITFDLTGPYSDFDYLMALPAAAPVPAQKEGGSGYVGANYTKRPMSDGPFKVDSYTAGQKISFVRNSQWAQSTDTIRHPLVDSIDLAIDENSDNNDKALAAGTLDALADGGVQQAFQAQILTDAKLKAASDDPVTGYTRYLALAPSVKPLDNIHCRRAIFYAASKALLQRARGGVAGGEIANTMTPPVTPGFDPSANAYPDGPGNNGNIAQAKAELRQCGKPNGFDINMAYVPTGRGTPVFEAVQESLSKVGITVRPKAGSQASYYTSYIGSPGNVKKAGLGIMLAGWAQDFPTGYGFWNSIANGKAILPQGNSNYTSLNDPAVNSILDSVTKSAGRHDAQFKQLDAEVMKDAVMLPFVYDKSLYYRNPRLTNVRCNFGDGSYYDAVNMGVK